MKICFIPIDNRPVCYNLAKDITSIDENIELFIPPREFLGDLKKNAGVNEILEWLENLPACDAMVLSLDTIAYGGLIPSRRGVNDKGIIENYDDIKRRVERLKPKDWGKKIFEYSFSGFNGGIPSEILEDYLETRRRNFEINKLYLEWQKEGIFDTLIFSKDDCAPKGFNVEEAQELERLGGKTKTGADEIPLTLLARAIEKNIKVFVEYTEPEYKNCISNYEDVSIEKSLLGQLELAGFTAVTSPKDADIILVVNNFIEKQGELVMGWDTEPYNKIFTPPPDKPYAIADVRFANGADNAFVNQLLPKIDLTNFYGYSGWNTSANSLGSLLASVKIRWNAKKFNQTAFKKLQMIRFLDDWAYQANVRGIIASPCNIKELMKPYEKILAEIFLPEESEEFSYSFPWNRKFEVEID